MARADAQRNRARVLAAAEAVLARDGVSASMRAVAEEAGVGLGTIYRHFPHREALYQAIIAARMRRLVAEADDLTDDGSAFFELFTRIVVTATEKKALADALAEAGVPEKDGLEDVAAAMRATIERLMVAAQRTGTVRADLGAPEVLALMTATCLAAEHQTWTDELRTRTLTVVFDGMRPRPAP